MRRELRTYEYVCDGVTANGMACEHSRIIKAYDVRAADAQIIHEWAWDPRPGDEWHCRWAHRED